MWCFSGPSRGEGERAWYMRWRFHSDRLRYHSDRSLFLHDVLWAIKGEYPITPGAYACNLKVEGPGYSGRKLLFISMRHLRGGVGKINVSYQAFI